MVAGFAAFYIPEKGCPLANVSAFFPADEKAFSLSACPVILVLQVGQLKMKIQKSQHLLIKIMMMEILLYC